MQCLITRQSDVCKIIMERWSGRVALVTGASAGIGACIAEELVKAGLKVVALARRVEKVEALQNNLVGAKGELFPLKGDVSKIEEIEATFEWIKKKFGRIDVLVNNAGIIHIGFIKDGDLKRFQEVINVNLVAAVACARLSISLMMEAGIDDGHIILINSTAGHGVPNVGVPALNVYPASKHGVTAFTESIRQELVYLKSKIRVTSISPGGVRTEITEASLAASGPEAMPILGAIVENLKEVNILESQDIADSVLYVLSTPPRVQIHEIIIKPVGEQH